MRAVDLKIWSILFNSIQFWSKIGSKVAKHGLLGRLGKTIMSGLGTQAEVTHEVDVPCFAPRIWL